METLAMDFLVSSIDNDDNRPIKDKSGWRMQRELAIATEIDNASSLLRVDVVVVVVAVAVVLAVPTSTEASTTAHLTARRSISDRYFSPN